MRRSAMAGDDALREELRRLVAAEDLDAAALVAGARRQAETRVRDLLAEAFAERLLAQVRAELSPPRSRPADAPAGRSAAEPAAPAPRHATADRADSSPPQGASHSAGSATPPADAGLGWYVYCVVGADHEGAPAGLTGVDAGHDVFRLEQDDLAAVVSRVPLAVYGEEPLREHLADMEWLELTARRHEEVLEQVARGGTPIPMRLCSIYQHESGVRGMLVREAAGLREALDHLSGKAEWGVKAFADVAAVPASPGDAPASPGGGEGTAYMQGRLVERRDREETQQRLDDACRAIHTALSAVAADGVISPPQRPEVSGRDLPMIFNASYLVADADREAFHAELVRLGDELAALNVELEATGPWPPYNFVPGAIGAAW